MCLRREPTLDRPDTGSPIPSSVAGNDIGAAAEMVSAPGEHHGTHTLVAPSHLEHIDESGHHDVVDGVATVGAIELQAQNRFGQVNHQPRHRLVRQSTHRRGAAEPLAKSATTASSAPARSLAFPGGSGRSRGRARDWATTSSRALAW